MAQCLKLTCWYSTS